MHCRIRTLEVCLYSEIDTLKADFQGGTFMEIRTLISHKSIFKQPMQAHVQNEIIVCKEGRGILYANGTEYHFSAGDIVCIPAGTMHEDLAPEPRLNGMVFFDNVGDAQMAELRIFHDSSHVFEQLVDMATDALLQDSPDQRAFAYALGDAMLRLLQSWGAAGTSGYNEAVSFIDKLIRQNFANPDFDLVAEIEKTGYSEGYFRRVFRATAGRPPQAQLNHMRIEYAKTQFRIFRDMSSIKRIGLESGFRDPYYFSRVFKQHEGISPTQFIENLK